MRTILLILVSIITTFAQPFSPTEVLFVPWGEDSLNNVRYFTAPDGRYGPQNFHIREDTIWVLDPVNKSIKSFSNNVLQKSLYAPTEAKDFAIKSDNEYICLVDNSVWSFKNNKPTLTLRPESPLPLIKSISLQNNELLIFNDNGTTSHISNNKIIRHPQKGIEQSDKYYEIKKISRAIASITIKDSNFIEIIKIDIPIESKNLGCIRLIGVDLKNRIFLDIDLILQDIPLKVKREVWVINDKGSHLAIIHVPTHYYSSIFRDFELTREGKLYHLISSDDGIHIMKWEFPDSFSVPLDGKYPEPFQKHLHYNDLEGSEFQGDEIKQDDSKQSVTREESLIIGDSYVQHQWTCTETNITNGVVQAPDGDLVQTPDWIHIGSNAKIPYKWGGFNTLPEYDDGMTTGKYAGDIHTAGVSSYARGVDCSGFVCRCWKLTMHYSTRMMDDPAWGPITLPYSSWDGLKPGDAIHRHGHVRLAICTNPNGTILAVEAAGSSTGWKVDYSSYTLSNLSYYTPRYYIHMEGVLVPPEPPVLLSTTQSDSGRIHWILQSLDNTDGVIIERQIDESGWEELYPDSVFSIDQTYCTTDLVNSLPNYFRLKSLNISKESIESMQTDVYGFYNNSQFTEKVLIVDGFDRTESSGSWHLPYHSFAQWMGEVLYEAGVSFETVSNETIINGEIYLNDYKAVFWILGDESTHDETFSSIEQNIVKLYLKNDGQLFVSGSEIAWDLDQDNSSSGTTPADEQFLHNYLKADYKQDNSGINNVQGITGSIFDGLSFQFDDGSQGIYEEDYPDVINSINGSSACLKYSSTLFAGIQYEGVFPDGTHPGKLVYLSFPWETIIDNPAKKEVIRRVATFFEFQCTGISHEIASLPTKAALSHGYPNPFNDRVNFQLKLPYPQDFNVSIYNYLGQIIKTFEYDNISNYNSINLMWNGKNSTGAKVSSGVYFFIVNLPNRKLVDRIVYLK